MKLLLNKRIPLVILSFTAFISCFAGGERIPAGGRSAGLAGASAAVSDVWSAFNNQAALASLEKPTMGVYYENRFGLKELSYKAAVYAHPTKFGTLALDASQFGFSLWSESKAGLAFGRSFGRYFAFGAQLDYIMINKGEPYGRFQLVTFEAGVLATLSPKFVLAAHVYNPLNVRISDLSDERVPSVFNLDAACHVTKQFLITTEVEKSIDEKINVKAGVEYQLIDAICIRTGVSTNPSFFSFGVGIHIKKFSIDISTTRHQTLGFSPQTSVIYAFD